MASFNRTSHLPIAINISVLDLDKSPLSEIMEIMEMISLVRGPFVCSVSFAGIAICSRLQRTRLERLSAHNDNVSIRKSRSKVNKVRLSKLQQR